MMPLGLTKAQYQSYMYSLFNGYELKVSVHLMRADHTFQREVGHELIDGQIDVTAPTFNSGDIEVSRTASLQFLDPGRTLALDSKTPAAGSFFFDRMLRVIYSVKCSFGWVDVPVFTGMVNKVDRDGDLVDVECQGKEVFALGSAWHADTKKGNKVQVMRDLLASTGESSRYMSIDPSTTRLAQTLSIPRDATVWSRIWKVNASLNRIMFYDGRGVFQSRPKPKKVSLVLRDGEGGAVVKTPQISYQNDETINAVRVVGAKASKGKTTPVAAVTAPKGHPLSPWSLGRNGKGLFRAEFIENGDLKTTKACRAVAIDTLNDRLMQQVNATVEVLPIPHLEPWDVLLLATPQTSLRFRAEAFSLPLVQSGGTGTPMTIGTTRNLRKPRRPVGRK